MIMYQNGLFFSGDMPELTADQRNYLINGFCAFFGKEKRFYQTGDALVLSNNDSLGNWAGLFNQSKNYSRLILGSKDIPFKSIDIMVLSRPESSPKNDYFTLTAIVYNQNSAQNGSDYKGAKNLTYIDASDSNAITLKLGDGVYIIRNHDNVIKQLIQDLKDIKSVIENSPNHGAMTSALNTVAIKSEDYY